MPINLVQPDLHGRELEAVAEQAPLANGRKCLFKIAPLRRRPVEQQMKVASPKLHVAGHGLAVQTEVFRLGAEQNVSHFVFVRQLGGNRFVAMHLLPTMRAAVGVAIGTKMRFRRRRLRSSRLVHPARLGHANSIGIAMPGHDVQQRNLHRKRELTLQLQVGRGSPKQ